MDVNSSPLAQRKDFSEGSISVRVSDYTAFFLLGELVEFGKTNDIFSQPQDKRTEDYITGRFG